MNRTEQKIIFECIQVVHCHSTYTYNEFSHVNKLKPENTKGKKRKRETEKEGKHTHTPTPASTPTRSHTPMYKMKKTCLTAYNIEPVDDVLYL